MSGSTIPARENRRHLGEEKQADGTAQAASTNLDTGIFDRRPLRRRVGSKRRPRRGPGGAVTIENRGHEDARSRAAQLCSEHLGLGEEGRAEPIVREGHAGPGFRCLIADDRTAEPLRNLPIEYRLGARHLYVEGEGKALFTYNETNAPRVFGPWAKSRRSYVKDAFHRQIVNGEDAVTPTRWDQGLRPSTVEVPPGLRHHPPALTRRLEGPSPTWTRCRRAQGQATRSTPCPA